MLKGTKQKYEEAKSKDNLCCCFFYLLGPKKIPLVWEEDMQLYSQYLERKVTSHVFAKKATKNKQTATLFLIQSQSPSFPYL